MKMPFGKYKDFEISDLPQTYINYLVSAISPGKVLDELQNELDRRKGKSITIKLAAIPWLEQLLSHLNKMPYQLLNKQLKCGDFIIERITKIE